MVRFEDIPEEQKSVVNTSFLNQSRQNLKKSKRSMMFEDDSANKKMRDFDSTIHLRQMLCS